MSHTSNKIALFIDGANSTQRQELGFDIDYKRLSRNSRVAEHCYARSITPQLSRIRNIPRSPADRLARHNGYTSSPRRPRNSSTQRPPQGQGNRISKSRRCDGAAEHVDQIVLFSGDGDFRSLSRRVQRRASGLPWFDDCEPAADDRRRVAASGRRLHRSGGAASKLGRDPPAPAPARTASHAPQFLPARDHHGAEGDDDDFDD